MKLSAKITTVTFLAAVALGAATLTGGCSVNSTTSTDTDGGPSSSSGGSSGTGSSSGSTTTDGGGDAAATTCEGNEKQTFKFPDACQACLDTKCCDKLKACYGQDPGDAGDVDCNTYSSCISDCNAAATPEDSCYDACDNATNQAIKTSYDILTQCADTNCATECGGN